MILLCGRLIFPMRYSALLFNHLERQIWGRNPAVRFPGLDLKLNCSSDVTILGFGVENLNVDIVDMLD